MPLQKEIIHLTFGALPNHISTHFFNQQSSHFQYEDALDGQEKGYSRTKEGDAGETPLLLDPTVDFQEGVGSRSGQSTFFPRQVLVDFRDNLGARWDAYDLVIDQGDDETDRTGEHDDGERLDYLSRGIVVDYGGILTPSQAANEGLRAWSSEAEILWTNREGKLKDARVGASSDEEYEESSSDFDGGATEEWDTRRAGVTQQKGVEAAATPTSSRRKHHRSRKPAAYAHNPPHPRTLCPLPVLSPSGVIVPSTAPAEEGHIPFATFEMGMSLARRMNREDDFFDERIRWFAEDSDALQSFNVTVSAFDGFAGLAHEVIQQMSDEYPKKPVLTWGCSSSTADEQGSVLSNIRLTNIALSLWSLSASSLFTPLDLSILLESHAQASKHFVRKSHLRDPYRAGALLAAHIDTVTLPMRLHDEALRRSAATLISSLNWRRDTPIASLSGCMPLPSLGPVQEAPKVFDPIDALLAARGYAPKSNAATPDPSYLSSIQRARQAAERIQSQILQLSPRQLHATEEKTNSHSCRPFARSIVARGNSKLDRGGTRDALEALTDLDEPAGRSELVPLAYNVQSASFPQMFKGLKADGAMVSPHEAKSEDRDRRCRVNQMPILSMLSTTPDTAYLLASARDWIDKTIIQGHEPLTNFGMAGARGRSGAGQAASDDTEGLLGGRDGLLEVREGLEELLGAYEEGNAMSMAREDDQVGTDEEFEADGSDWDI